MNRKPNAISRGKDAKEIVRQRRQEAQARMAPPMGYVQASDYTRQQRIMLDWLICAGRVHLSEMTLESYREVIH